MNSLLVNITNTPLVSLATAKLIKEAGVSYPNTQYFYDEKGNRYPAASVKYSDEVAKIAIYPAPFATQLK